MFMRNAYCLSNVHNAASDFMIVPHGASLKNIISSVALFMRAISTHYKARLGSDAFKARRINTKLVKVPYNVFTRFD